MEFEQVRDIIVETLGCDAEQVTMDASLADDLGADSLVAPLKGIAHEQPVRAVLKYIDTAYIELKPHNLKDGVDGLAGVL